MTTDDNYIQIIRNYLGNEISIVENSENPIRKALLKLDPCSREDVRDERYSTWMAFEYMLKQEGPEKDFMALKKSDLLNGDLKTQVGTLSEIIAYYCLCRAGFKVEYQSTDDKPTADYKITSPEGEQAIIEVTSRGLCDEAQGKIKEAKQALDEAVKNNKDPNQRIHIVCPTIIRPYGYSSDSCTADAISKICSMKKEEHQLSEGLPSILWADFGVTGDFTTAGGLFYPLNSWNGCITSGHFWYGFYGRKGFPIYTNFSVNNENNITLEKVEIMKHDGRFYQKTKLSGCIFRCSSYSFFYEHPEPLNPISDNFRKRLLLLPKFSIEKSLANFYPGLVKEKNEQIEKLIKSFY